MTISDHEIHSLAYLNWPYDKLARWLSREKGFTITERRIELAFDRAQKKSHRRPRGVRAGDLVTIRPEVQNEAPIAGRDHTSSYRQSTVDLGNALEKYWNKRLEAEQALTDMEAQKDRIHDLLTAVSSESNAYLVRLERIAAIPNNGKNPNGGLLKAQRIAGAV